MYVKRDPTSQQPRTPTSAPDTPQSQKSPSESPVHACNVALENECKELTVNLGEKIEKMDKLEKPFPMLAPDDPPYFPETWLVNSEILIWISDSLLNIGPFEISGLVRYVHCVIYLKGVSWDKEKWSV